MKFRWTQNAEDYSKIFNQHQQLTQVFETVHSPRIDFRNRTFLPTQLENFQIPINKITQQEMDEYKKWQTEYLQHRQPSHVVIYNRIGKTGSSSIIDMMNNCLPKVHYFHPEPDWVKVVLPYLVCFHFISFCQTEIILLTF
jgi:hypothetical protein